MDYESIAFYNRFYIYLFNITSYNSHNLAYFLIVITSDFFRINSQKITYILKVVPIYKLIGLKTCIRLHLVG